MLVVHYFRNQQEEIAEFNYASASSVYHLVAIVIMTNLMYLNYVHTYVVLDSGSETQI